MMFSCFCFYNGCRLFIYFIGWQRVRSLLGALRRGYGVDCDKLQCLPNTWNVFQNVYQTPEMFSKMLTKHLKCFPKKYKMFTNHLRSQAKKFCSCSSKWKNKLKWEQINIRGFLWFYIFWHFMPLKSHVRCLPEISLLKCRHFVVRHSHVRPVGWFVGIRIEIQNKKLDLWFKA